MFFLNALRAIAQAAVLAAVLSYPSAVLSAGLGRLAVVSALGQPLNAEIEVLASAPGDLTTLSARLATPDAYREAGLDYVADLTALQFTVVPRGSGRAVIRVTSNTPIVEPVLNLLLEVSWASGKLQRRYAALLDPPGYGAQVAAAAATPPVLPPPASALPAPVMSMPRPAPPRAVAPPAGVAAVAPRPVPAEPTPQPPAAPVAASERAAVTARGPASPRPAPRGAEPPASRPAPSAGAPGSYGPVRRGETLSQIAQRVVPDGATLQQALAALYDDNPTAFIDENMNRLKAGAVLRLPTADQVNAVPPAAARRLLAEHLAGRRATLAELGYVPESRAAPADSASARGRVSSAIDSERLPAPATGADTLRLSRGPGEGAGPAAPERTASKQDEMLARDQSVRDARARIADLQQQIRDVERLLALVAAGQGAGSGAPAGVAVNTLPAPLPAAPASAPAAPPEKAPPAASGPPPAAAGPPPPAKSRPPAPPPPEPTLLGRLQGDLFWAAALVVILLGVGAIAVVRRLQRPAPAASGAGAPKAPGPRGAAAAARRVTAPAAADEADFLADLDKATSVAGAGEPADPVAEADSLITYGRHAQAEEVLKAALAANTNQPQVALRLLDLYHAKKDAAAFDSVARQLQAAVGGSSALWRKAAEMGAQIDPGNRLYGRAPDTSALQAPATSPSGAADADQAPLAPSAPPTEAPPPLDFVAGMLSEPSEPKPDDVVVEPLGAESPALDLPSLDFTAPAPAAAAAALESATAQAQPPGPSADGVGTRLDLAKAYLDIGDKAGARDLLKEVVRSGSPAQRAEAETLLGSL